MAVRFSALHAGRPLPPGRFLVLISVKRLSLPQGHSATGRIRSTGKKIHLIGTRTRDLPACSIVPQPTTLNLQHNIPSQGLLGYGGPYIIRAHHLGVHTTFNEIRCSVSPFGTHANPKYFVELCSFATRALPQSKLSIMELSKQERCLPFGRSRFHPRYVMALHLNPRTVPRPPPYSPIDATHSEPLMASLNNYMAHTPSLEANNETRWSTCDTLDLYSAGTLFESRTGHRIS
jgi:hypothetical protein